MEASTKHIAPSEWERHREAIINLRRSGIILEGEEGIMAIMERDHGFIGRSSQYELQFNKWEERKNLRADEWRQIIQTVDQQNEDGMNCDVYRNGQLIPRCTLKRKRKEYCKEQEHVKRCQLRVAASSLPAFIELRTSPSANQTPEFQDSSVHEDLSVGIRAIAPSIIEPDKDVTALNTTEVGRCQIVDLILGNLTVTSSPLPQQNTAVSDTSLVKTRHIQSPEYLLPWTTHDTSAEMFPFELDSLTPMHQQFNFAEIGPGIEVDTGLPVARLSDTADFSIPDNFSALDRRPASRNAILFGRDKSDGTIFNLDLVDPWTSCIPFLRFEEHLQSQENIHPREKYATHIQQPADKLQRDLMSLDYAIESGSSPVDALVTYGRSIFAQGDPTTSSDALTHAEMFKSNLSSLLPSDAISSAFNSRTTIQNQAFTSSFQRSLIFSIGNNFAGLEGVPKGNILKYLAKDPHKNFRLMKYLRASPKYVCKALAENLIRAAIEDCDATLVTALMITGLATPDEIVCLVEEERYTAVERSAMLRSTEVTKALLVAGAEVNKTYLGWGPLRLAIGKNGISESVDIQLVNLLLESGAKVRPTDILYAARENDATLVRNLMYRFSPSSRHEYLQTNEIKPGFIETAVQLLDRKLATLIVTQMLEACLQSGCGECPKSCSELRMVTSIAAMRGFSEIVILLLEYTPKEDLPLAAAVRSGEKDLIELLLKQGADVDSPASSMIGHEFDPWTPLAEAIRGGNNELVQDFENRGAFSHIQEGGRFRAAIYAAAEVKNIACAQKLLQNAPDISGTDLDLALEISIKEGHEELALLLLRAGADVNTDIKVRIDNGDPFLKDDIASLMALRQKNEILVRAVMGCNMLINPGQTGHYDSPLLLAARWGNLCIIRGLLSMGVNVDGDGETDDARDKKVRTDNDNDHNDDDNDYYHDRYDMSYFRETAITAAIKRSNKFLVELLVNEHQASLNLFSDRKTSPLAAAISNKDVDMFWYLLKLGADPACHSAFIKAISEDREMLSELLRAFHANHPAGKAGFGGVPLRIAITQNDERLLDALLEAKLDVNSFAVAEFERINSLGTAIRKHGRHNLKIIRKLIFEGSDPSGVVVTANNCRPDTVQPKTALLEAISTKNRALVELLVKAGADTNRPAQLGIKRTPLQRACEVGSLDIVEFLLDRGADVNEEPAFRGGGTSLQLCAIGGYAGIAEKLLKHGAHVNAASPEMHGRTALESAAEYGRLDMLKILWDAIASEGFDLEQVGRAMKLAERNGHFACRDFIQELIGQAFIMPDSLEF